ncbi:MAG: polyphosphate kinase 1 [Halobacteria archaeon]|nr:polyphosphate kinase 1 [Halobacteria archaeon]
MTDTDTETDTQKETEYSCPVEGCDFSSDNVGSVKGHLSRKETDGHKGLTAKAGTGDTVEVVGEPRTETDESDEALNGSDSENTEESRPTETKPSLEDPDYYLNRELSELEFQRRVLHEAVDDRNPLLERVRFLSIFTRNMDEFFMKRVGGLKQQIAAGVTELTPDGMTPQEQLDAILEQSREMFERQSDCYRDCVLPELTEEGVEVLDYDDLSDAERRRMRQRFKEEILPVLTPLTFDPAHPFPFISNLSLSLGVLTKGEDDEEPVFSRIKIPKNRPRLLEVESEGEDENRDGDTRFVLIEDVIADSLDLIFPSVEIVDCSSFRVTRNAEVKRNEEVAEDLIEMIEEVLRERRFATVVRLEVEEGTPDAILDVLTQQLEVDEDEVFELQPPLDMGDLSRLTEVERPDLSLEAWTPQPHPRLLGDGSVFDEIRSKDILLHHPYHSFEGTVQRFLDEAASDPDVLAIKLAIYRTAPDSKVIESIIQAAKNGKQVAVMVELKARFDEENNLRWVEQLEEEGIHVAYGTLGYKTHTKTALAVRDESDGVRIYSHVATGNYHSETAKGYTDLGLLTADEEIGHDVMKLFNFFTGHSHHDDYDELLVAPGNMRERFSDLIRNEADVARRGGDARIVAKMNRLEDPEIVRLLYEASVAGVEIELVVRDICRLRPGIEGVSDNIEVTSIVGRFLEHSRIFRFENDDPGYYIGSADWMTRNLDSRVEAVTPIHDSDLQSQLDEILRIALSDNTKSWEMKPDGSYVQNTPDGDQAVNSQEALMEKTRHEVEETRRRMLDSV